MSAPVLFPRPLVAGDTVAIVSPAGRVDPAQIDAAAAVMEGHGWRVDVGAHARGVRDTYSGTPDQRYSDLRRAFTDRRVRAILCARGGYGAVHLLERLSRLDLREDPKWVVGFSDVTALHGLMHSQGVASVHAPMTRVVARGLQDPDCAALVAMLEAGADAQRPLTFPGHPLDRPGLGQGTLLGGNLAVMGGLAGTPYDMMRPGAVLVIEDVAEPIYRVERMLWQLRLSGVLPRLAALMVGRFTDYASPDHGYADMYRMVSDMVAPYSYPVAYGVPVGHVDAGNAPLMLGARATLKVSPDGDNHLIYWRG